MLKREREKKIVRKKCEWGQWRVRVCGHPQCDLMTHLTRKWEKWIECISVNGMRKKERESSGEWGRRERMEREKTKSNERGKKSL